MNLFETRKDYSIKYIKNASDSLFTKESKICELDFTINNYTFTVIEKTKCTEKYLKNGI